MRPTDKDSQKYRKEKLQNGDRELRSGRGLMRPYLNEIMISKVYFALRLFIKKTAERCTDIHEILC